MELIIGEEYYFRFAGSTILGKYIKTITSYGNNTFYVFRDIDTNYPIELKQIINKK